MTLPRQAGIYRILNTITGKCYVGSSVNMYNRYYGHRGALLRGTHHSRYLQNSWNKYGEVAFVWDVLEPVSDVSQLHIREQFWIDQLQPAYNRALQVYPATWLGKQMSAEMRAKMSIAHKGKHQTPEWATKRAAAWIGRKHRDESREKMSTSRQGKDMPWLHRPRSQETKRKLSEWRKGRKMSPEAYAKHLEASARRRGQPTAPLSEETKAKISDAHKGKALAPEHRAHFVAAGRVASQTPEAKAKRAASLRNRVTSPETRAKISAARRGTKASQETRARMSAARKRWLASKES